MSEPEFVEEGLELEPPPPPEQVPAVILAHLRRQEELLQAGVRMLVVLTSVLVVVSVAYAIFLVYVFVIVPSGRGS